MHLCFSVDISSFSLAPVALGRPFVSCPSYDNSYEPSEWLIKPILIASAAITYIRLAPRVLYLIIGCDPFVSNRPFCWQDYQQHLIQ